MIHMTRKLPPLNALRAFEAAARHMSFTRAADELHVTQSAVSHQVKTLEDWLGFPLFRRRNRTIELSSEGFSYLPTLSAAFDELSEATVRLRMGRAERPLTLSTTDTFASSWLVPRLRRFRAAHPEIDVRITTSDGLVDFAQAGVDVGIRYGRGEWPGMTAKILMTEDLFPVCSPALLAHSPPLKVPADLAHFTLLHDDMNEDWPKWLAAAGATEVDASRGPLYGHSYLVIQAAIEGEGVALGRSALIGDALADGRLVRPFAGSVRLSWAHYVVWLDGTGEDTRIKKFYDWLMAEVAQTPATEQ